MIVISPLPHRLFFRPLFTRGFSSARQQTGTTLPFFGWSGPSVTRLISHQSVYQRRAGTHRRAHTPTWQGGELSYQVGPLNNCLSSFYLVFDIKKKFLILIKKCFMVHPISIYVGPIQNLILSGCHPDTTSQRLLLLCFQVEA